MLPTLLSKRGYTPLRHADFGAFNGKYLGTVLSIRYARPPQIGTYARTVWISCRWRSQWRGESCPRTSSRHGQIGDIFANHQCPQGTEDSISRSCECMTGERATLWMPRPAGVPRRVRRKGPADEKFPEPKSHVTPAALFRYHRDNYKHNSASDFSYCTSGASWRGPAFSDRRFHHHHYHHPPLPRV